MEGEKLIFLCFYLEVKRWEKTGGARVFSPCAHQNTISSNQRENEREKGKKKSHMFLTNKTFLFFPLLSISSFIFCLFLLLLNHFSALSFVCSYPFFSHLFIYLFIFFTSVSFPHLFCVTLCVWIVHPYTIELNKFYNLHFLSYLSFFFPIEQVSFIFL